MEQNLLYHYLLDLEEYRKSGSVTLDSSTLGHLDYLVDYIKKTYTLTTERLGPLLEKRQITYDLLWTLCKPNNLAYTKCFGTGQSRCVRYEFGEERTATGGVKYFYIKTRYLDFDGKVFGESSCDHAIEKFRGAKPITALKVFPLQYHQNERDTRARLTECGKKFLSMMDVHHYQYQGTAFYISREKKVVQIFVKSRILVDATYFREENPNYERPSIKESDESSSDSGWTLLGSDESSEKSASVKSNGMDPSEVKGDDLLICSPTVPGYSLGNKQWGEYLISSVTTRFPQLMPWYVAEFAVANIKEIAWKQAALDDLQLPLEKKKVVQALAEAHVKRASTNLDFVEGKGQGFIVLLQYNIQLLFLPRLILTYYISGSPGVGKTLTVELLSEHLQTSLIQVSAGELGTTAEAVEARLPYIFQRAARWKSLLLLDEADVFLQQRSVSDIHRNALVCVFLRTLEYYQGVMFLTTNRLDEIDDAIASRIHFKIKYGNLDQEQRTGIWRGLLEKATTPQGAPVYSLTAFDDWVRKKRNGREVRSF